MYMKDMKISESMKENYQALYKLLDYTAKI